MMVGYHKKCKICNCEQRAEVERLHEVGSSLQQIADFLSDYGVSLSKQAVKRHFDTHFAPREEVARRYYEESQKVMEETVERRLSDLELLNENITQVRKLRDLAARSIEESLTTEQPVILKNGRPLLDPKTFEPVTRKYPPAKPIVDLFNGAASELRQSAKLKAELLGDKDPEGTVNIDMSAFTMEELKALANLDAGKQEDSS